MASDVSTIQSLKAVDAWIDVINANINGGVRTAFKSSRLKFAGSNTDVARSGTSTSLPLQFPEPGLTTANTVIDFSQGAITASTENTHLAIQGDGFFAVCTPDLIDRNPASATFGGVAGGAVNAKVYLTRDGEFHTGPEGLLVNNDGLYLLCPSFDTYGATVAQVSFDYALGYANGGGNMRAVYNNMDQTPPVTGIFVHLDTFLTNAPAPGSWMTDHQGNSLAWNTSVVGVRNPQLLRYSSFGSTVFDLDFKPDAGGGSTPNQLQQGLIIARAFSAPDSGKDSMGTSRSLLSKSLEASNASMTQSVPELSLAQKLFSALTKVLQTKQTNVDGVLNLVR